MRSVLAILLLGLGLTVLRYTSKFLFLNLTLLVTSYSSDNLPSTMIRWLDIVMTTIDVGVLYSGSSLGETSAGKAEGERCGATAVVRVDLPPENSIS